MKMHIIVIIINIKSIWKKLTNKNLMSFENERRVAEIKYTII